MRKAKIFYATRGDLTATGKTKSEARASLESMVDWSCRRTNPVIESRYGLIISIAAGPSGFESRVFDPADLAHGKQYQCSTCTGQVEYTDVLESARCHAAQIAWNADIDDSAHIAAAGLAESKARELASWIQFQRNYVRAINGGQSPAQAFNSANGLPIAA